MDPLNLAESTKSPLANDRCRQPYRMYRREYWTLNVMGLVLIGIAVLLNRWLIVRGMSLTAGLGLLFYVQWWSNWRRLRYRFNRQFMASLDCFIDILKNGGTPLTAYQYLADHAPWPTNRMFKSVVQVVAVTGFSEIGLNRVNVCLGSRPLDIFTAVMVKHFGEGGDLAAALETMKADFPRSTLAEYWYGADVGELG